MPVALERRATSRLLSAVLRERVRQGMGVGLIAAAATAGALVGFGLARRAPLRPLNAVAHLLIGSRALFVEGFDVAVTPLGIALHTLSVVVWAVLFAVIAGGLRGLRLVASAAALAALAFLIDYVFVPERLQPGFEATLSAAELAATYTVLALALAAGVRWTASPADTG
jgi:hypothetical protein